jgi:VWFA-related protein
VTRILLGLATTAGLLAQNVTFRADSQLVLTGFHATRGEEFIRDLRPEEIVILEDGEPQPVATFEGGTLFRRTLPMRVVLLFDCSNSVRAAGLLNPKVFEPALLAGYPQVSVGIYGFTHVTRPLVEPTRRMDLLEAAVEEILHFPAGLTRIYEAVLETVARLTADRTPATRAIVILSDSMAPADAQPEAIRAARDNDIALYPVVLARNPKDLFAAPSRLNPFEKTVRTFAALAAPTGGRVFRPKWSQKSVLPQILDALLEQVGAEYVAGYYASPERGPGVRRVEVKLRSPERGEIRGGERSVVP